MPEVSLIIPLYGPHRGRSVLPTVARAWLMQDVSCEVIVATPGRHTEDMMLDDVGAEPIRVLAGDVAVTAPGLLRNLAAAHATAPRLYSQTRTSSRSAPTSCGARSRWRAPMSSPSRGCTGWPRPPGRSSNCGP
ncbi:MAG: hypothetical protein QOF69_1494 [Solirubrobacteraceae bacterium]|nr:hypothetical protein [Solirubrobacteraceae bacterium]